MASSLPLLEPPDIGLQEAGGSTMAAAEDDENDMLGIDDLLVTLSAAADASLIAAEAATEAERLAAIAAEEAAEAYVAASAAVGTDAFARLRDIAEAAERNTEELTSAAAAAYKTYFLACAQSMDASAAVEAAELSAAQAALDGGAAEDEGKKDEKAEPKLKSVAEKPNTPASKTISKLAKPSKLVHPQPGKPCSSFSPP